MTGPNPQEGGKEQGFLPESPSADAGPSPRSPDRHLILVEDGERLWVDLARLGPTELRSLIDAANAQLDVQLGNCTTCSGSGREYGDEDFECFSCGGTGRHDDELRRMENDFDDEDDADLGDCEGYGTEQPQADQRIRDEPENPLLQATGGENGR